MLPTGKVLVTGGSGDKFDDEIASAELYDPASGSWTATSSLATARYAHTATLLPNGKVIVVAGVHNFDGRLASAELYDPASGSWTATGSLVIARSEPTALLLPNGKLLVAGGRDINGFPLATAELYDPASGNWTVTGSLVNARYSHTATLLPDGKALVAGSSSATASAEVYDSANGSWTATGSLATGRYAHTATLLPNGKVLVAGGHYSSSGMVLASAELYDPANGTWKSTGGLATARYYHTATFCPTARCSSQVATVLTTSTSPARNSTIRRAEPGRRPAVSPPLDIFTRRRYCPTARCSSQVATVLTLYLASAELYDPATWTWTLLRQPRHPATDIRRRRYPTAKSLSQAAMGTPVAWRARNSTIWRAGLGQLLPASQTLVIFTRPRYSPAERFWSRVAMGTVVHTASAELYDPTSRTWTATGSLATGRDTHTAMLLPNGNVLVAGGYNYPPGPLSSVELYNPINGIWTTTGRLVTERDTHTSTLLPNGKVLVAGGYHSFESLASAELYDPTNGAWTVTGGLGKARHSHTATLRPDGKVLVAGGVDFYTLASAELYDVGLAFTSAWQPQISKLKLTDGKPLFLTGSLFQGISQTSDGNTQNSSSNYPIIQLRSIDNSEVAFLSVDTAEGWSDTSFSSLPVKHFPFGPALVTVFTNGIPRSARYVVVAKCDH